MAPKQFEKIESKQVMNRVQAPSMPFDWSINPYRGCTHGCSFCYARATHSFLGMEADDTFQNHILLKMNAPEALEKQLERMARRFGGNERELGIHVGLVAIGTATDPYQPVEGRAQITRECLKILARYQIPTTITTRSPLILRDLDILKEMWVTSVNISINTLNRDIWKSLEPASPFPLKRMETVQELVENGIHTGIFLAPIMPYLTDSTRDLYQVIEAAQRHRARFVMPSILRLAPEVKVWFFQVLSRSYPHLKEKYARLYRTGYPTAAYKASLLKRVYGVMDQFGYAPDRDERDDWRRDWQARQKWDRSETEKKEEAVQLSLPI
ncbi:MAG: radical SAM protein [Bacillaceae bacterium]|nr:radical SAM protein [Bacillaceae bacterium]